MIPPNLHFNTPNADIPALLEGRMKVVTAPTKWDGGFLGISSFGFGGANTHVILRAPKPQRPTPVSLAAFLSPPTRYRLSQNSERTWGVPEASTGAEALSDIAKAMFKKLPRHNNLEYDGVLSPLLSQLYFEEVRALEEVEGIPRLLCFSSRTEKGLQGALNNPVLDCNATKELCNSFQASSMLSSSMPRMSTSTHCSPPNHTLRPLCIPSGASSSSQSERRESPSRLCRSGDSGSGVKLNWDGKVEWI